MAATAFACDLRALEENQEEASDAEGYCIDEHDIAEPLVGF